MQYYFFPINATEARDGTKIGYDFLNSHRDRLIQNDDLAVYFTVGAMKGVDHLVHDNKAYRFLKAYVDVDNSSVYLVGVESVDGCDRVRTPVVNTVSIEGTTDQTETNSDETDTTNETNTEESKESQAE